MILVLQIISVVTVIALFQILPNVVAGFIASFIFISIACVSIYYFFARLKYKSLAIYVWFGFLVCIALPMLAFRAYYIDIATSEIFIGPIAFDLLHKVAEKIYVLAFVANAIDYIRIKKATQ